MLTELNIENVAVIERAAIRFDGLNVLTGETGAGKSIVIDAINAVLGARTSKDVVRTGARDAAPAVGRRSSRTATFRSTRRAGSASGRTAAGPFL